MKKTVILIRHAKSSWKHPELEDMQRPLNGRGKRDAPVMGKRFKELNLKPDLMLSSPAKRALKTARTFADQIGYPKKGILIENDIYHGGPAQILNCLRALEESTTRVCLFGHNPSITTLASMLCDFTEDTIPTCGMVGISFEVNSWSEVAQGRGTMLFFEYPKKYQS